MPAYKSIAELGVWDEAK